MHAFGSRLFVLPTKPGAEPEEITLPKPGMVVVCNGTRATIQTPFGNTYLDVYRVSDQFLRGNTPRRCDLSRTAWLINIPSARFVLSSIADQHEMSLDELEDEGTVQFIFRQRRSPPVTDTDQPDRWDTLG